MALIIDYARKTTRVSWIGHCSLEIIHKEPHGQTGVAELPVEGATTTTLLCRVVIIDDNEINHRLAFTTISAVESHNG